MGKTLHALLIGIGEYKYSSNLEAPGKDVAKMKTFLEELRTKEWQVNIHELQNEEATRQNIIDSFTNNLVNEVKKGEYVIFFYAGHGGQEKAHKAFKDHEADDRLEGIVCYDSGYEVEGGKPYIVDKELRYLMQGLDGKEVEMIMIFDCCHSGDISRLDQSVSDEQSVRLRRLSGVRPGRPWKDFIFSEKWTEVEFANGDIDELLKPIKHVQLAACASDEYSWEHPLSGGFYSKYLFEILRKTNGLISYKELQRRIRLSLRSVDVVQNPQAYAPEAYSGEVNKVFLGNNIIDTPTGGKAHKVKGEDKWILDMGAISGIKIGQEATFFKEPKISTMVRVTEVYIDRCEIEFLNKAAPNELGLDGGEIYKVEVAGLLQEKINVFIDPDHVALGESLVQEASKLEELNIIIQNHEKGSFLRIDEIDDQYSLSYSADSDRRPIIKEIPKNSEAGEQLINDLGHIGRWYAIKNLQNPSPLHLHQAYLQAKVILKFNEDTPAKLTYQNYQFETNHAKDGEPYTAFKFVVKNLSEVKLFVACLNIGSEFDVNPNMFIPNVVPIEADGEAAILAGKNLKTVLPPHIRNHNWKEEVVFLKLIASTERFMVDAHELPSLQMPVSKRKGPKRGLVQEDIDQPDWISQNFELRLKNPYYVEEE